MKKIGLLIFLTLSSLISICIGIVQHNETIKYIGIIIGSFILINLVLNLLKVFYKFTINSLLSIISNIVSLIILGIVSFHNLIPSFAIYILCTIFSVMLIISILRKLSEYSIKHDLANSILVNIINYNYKGDKHQQFITIRDKRVNKRLASILEESENN
jgi:hypothetical protein